MTINLFVEKECDSWKYNRFIKVLKLADTVVSKFINYLKQPCIFMYGVIAAFYIM